MNRLQHETSPYLLQHASNPVEWYAWKAEAFEKAQKEDKPILVSIGYSTCHWCHVMERESFEKESVAAFMNEHFVNIKVDREERPDVDQIYMEACQAISGGGGWPLNCFLTPDGKPFYAGTYFPPQPVHNRISWMQLLQNIARTYQEKRETIEKQADRLTEIIKGSDVLFINDALLQKDQKEVFNEGLVEEIYQNLAKGFDKQDGGFGGAPKFPGTMGLKFLLDHHHFTGQLEALEHVIFSLEKMIRGGIYDQLGGGFARYTVDKAWLVPHFEKMLYDNALLVSVMSDLYRHRPLPLVRRAIEETLEFIDREMTSPEGGFYSALDADSEGVEGKFYVWDKEEVDSILGENAELFCEFYQVTASGNWEGHNILWCPVGRRQFAKSKGIEVQELADQLSEARERLFEKRAERIRPGLDDKIILAWNALQCSAYAQAYAALGNSDYKDRAVRSVEFMLDAFKTEGKEAALYHTYKEGTAQYDAFLDDYSLLIAALLEVYEITFEERFLYEADQLATYVLDNFLDPDNKMFYFTSEKQQDLILRRKDMYDSALPSGNSTMALNLHKLGILMGKEPYREISVKMLTQVVESVNKYPTSFSRWAAAIQNLVYPTQEIAITGTKADEVAKAINQLFIPNKVIMASETATDAFPLLAGKDISGDINIYVCKDYTCQLPVKSLKAFKESFFSQAT